MRIDEINERLAAIDSEIDTAEGEALAALETEVAELRAERQQIQDDVQRRQQLRSDIATGRQTATIIEERTEEDTNMEERTFTLESAEYRSAFLKHLRGDEMTDTEKRAFTYLTANTTAPLPTETQNRIIDLIGEAHPIVADVYTMYSNTAISIPVAKSIEADANRTIEMGQSAELQITFDTVNLAGGDFTANVKLSYMMKNMAIPAFEDYIVSQISARLGAQLAGTIVLGIRDRVSIDNKITSGVSYASICAAFGQLKRVGPVVVYGTRKGVYNKLVGMVDSNKRPIFQQAITADVAGTLLGCTIKFEDALRDDEFFIGDPKKYFQNVVAPIIIESDKNLDNHTLVYSGYTCQEGVLTDDKAFALVSDGEGQ